MTVTTKGTKAVRMLLNPALFVKVMLVIMLLLNMPYIGDIAKLIIKAVPVWGGLVFIANLKYVKETTKGKFYLLLVLMAFFYGVTILVNFRFNLIQNIKSWIWYVIYVGILLVWWRTGCRDREEICRDIKQINWFVITVNLINVLSCVICLVSDVGIWFHNRPIGIWENKLFGVMDGLTHSMMIALISVLAAGMNKKIDEKPSSFKNAVYLVNLVCTYISITASGSRSMRFITATMIALYCVAGLWKRWDADKYLKNLKKAAAVTIFLGGLVFILAYGAVEMLRYPVGMLPLPARTVRQWYAADNDFGGKTEQKTEGVSETDDFLSEEIVIRDPKTERESTELRLGIWKECIAIWKEHPFFGVGNANYYMESTHSTPVALLVYSGAVGTVIFAVYLIGRMLTGFWSLFKNSRQMDWAWFSMLFSFMICLALCMFGIFETVIIFSNVENTVLFWIYLGIMEIAEHNIAITVQK